MPGADDVQARLSAVKRIKQAIKLRARKPEYGVDAMREQRSSDRITTGHRLPRVHRFLLAMQRTPRQRLHHCS
jgi:hypothetical protein